MVFGLEYAGQANRRRLLGSYGHARVMLRCNGGINHYQKCES